MIELYTESKVCEMLDLTSSQLKEKRDRGEISCFHVHAKVYKYSEEHLLEYLKSREKKAKEKPCAASQDSLKSPAQNTGMSSIMTESEADVALRAVKSARRIGKRVSSLPPSPSNARNQQQESRIN